MARPEKGGKREKERGVEEGAMFERLKRGRTVSSSSWVFRWM